MIGLVIIVALNVLFVPKFGYIACAWAAFVCYFVMMFLSWLVGQKYYPIHYDLKSIGKYLFLALVLYGIAVSVPYRKHVAAFGVPDHPVIYLSDLSDQARPAVESDSLSQQTDFKKTKVITSIFHL